MTRSQAYRVLTRAFIRSTLNNKVRLLLAGVGLVVAVNALYQAPTMLSNLGQRTVKVAVTPGTDARLVAELHSADRVKAFPVTDMAAAHADLASGRADALVAGLDDGRAGVRVESAGIFGEVAAKTVVAVAQRQTLSAANVPYHVVERRDEAHGQLLGLLLPALLTLTLLSAATLAFGSLSALRSSGMLQRLQVSGVTALPLLASITTANLLLSGLAMVGLVVSATVLTGAAPAVPALVATAALGFILLSSAGLLLASRFKNAQNASAAAGYAVGVLTLPAMVPVPNLTSSSGQWLVTATPTGALAESFRAALHGADAQPLSHVLPIVLAWSVLLTAVAIRYFRWENERG